MADWRKAECCGTCKHWDLKKVQHKNGAVPERGIAKCLVEIPAIPLPLSVDTRNSWSYRKPEPGFMGRDSGLGCPFYERRPKDPTHDR